MTSSLNKLNEHIDQLVIWFRGNKGIKLSAIQKTRLSNILKVIIDSEATGDQNMETLKDEFLTNELLGKSKEQLPVYINCENCKVRLNRKNYQKHKNKCVPISSKTRKKKPKSKTFSKPKNSAIKPDVNNSQIIERKEERRLDGSRDYWQIRDQGRWGSHSVYDDMGDDSSS